MRIPIKVCNVKGARPCIRLIRARQRCAGAAFTLTRMASQSSPRVNTSTTIRPSDLSTYHRNARRGNIDAITGSLKANGQYKPIVVNIGTHTGRPNEVLAGNHTLMAFRNLAELNPTDERWNEIAVYWVDVDEDRATRIVLADNRTAEDSTYDDVMLYDLIKSLGDDLDGSGFNDRDVDRLGYLDKLFGSPDEGDDGPQDYDAKDTEDVMVDIGKTPSQCAEVGLSVGRIRVKVPREVYVAWYDGLREDVGYDDDTLRETVLARLGLAE